MAAWTLKSRLIVLLGVLAACAALRVWLIAHTEVIARDGVTYSRMARELPTYPLHVVKHYDYHVGYPAAVVGMHWLRRAVGFGGDGPFDWDVSGQIVSLAASVAAVAAIWLITAMTFNWSIAWMSALLFALGRKWSCLGADVLSDALAVSLELWTVVLALVTLEKLKRADRRAIAWSAATGLCAALGYLVRPEALLVAPVAGAMWLVWQKRRGRSWSLAIGAAATALAVALVCALPYMLAIGSLTKKKSLGDLFGSMPSAPAVVIEASAGAVGWCEAAWQVVRRLPEAMHPATAVPAGIWLVAIVIQRLRPSPLTAVKAPTARWGGVFMLVASVIVFSPVLMGLYRSAGYLTYRHVMFLGAMLTVLAGAGASVIANLPGAVIGPNAVTRIFRFAFVPIIAAGLAFHSLRPLEPGKDYYRRAATFISNVARTDDYVITESPWILHYSQVEGGRIWFNSYRDHGAGLRMTAADLLAQVHRTRATYLVFSDRHLRKADGSVAELLAGPAFVQVRAFAQKRGYSDDTIRVYRAATRTSLQATEN